MNFGQRLAAALIAQQLRDNKAPRPQEQKREKGRVSALPPQNLVSAERNLGWTCADSTSEQ